MSEIPTAAEIFEHFKEHKPKIEINGRTYWVVEGDLRVDRNQLLVLRLGGGRTAPKAGTAPEQREGLVAMADQQGRPVRWPKGRVLTYAVRRATFTDEQYRAVVDGLSKATSEWEAACGVNFQHLVEFDTGEAAQAEPPLFDVAFNKPGPGERGSSLSPSSPVTRPKPAPPSFCHPTSFQSVLRPDRDPAPRAGPHPRVPARVHPLGHAG